MVTGTSQADVGVVIIPSARGEFESAISGGTLKDHIMISGVLGVKKLILCINKMDTIPKEEQESRFNEVSAEMRSVVMGIHPDKDPLIIPISGYQGINVVEKGLRFEWFKGWSSKGDPERKVFTLEGALDYQSVPPRPIDKPLRVCINDCLKISGIGTVLTGQVVSGKLSLGMSVNVMPAGVFGEIKSLEVHKTPVPEVLSGENCGFVLKVTKGDTAMIKTGNVLSNSKAKPVVMSRGARCKIVVVDHPKGIKMGYTPVMDIATSHVPARIAKLLSRKAKGVDQIENPEIVIKGDNAVVVIMPQKECVMEGMKETQALGRLALRDGGRIVAIGCVDEVLSDDELKKMDCEVKKGEKKVEVKSEKKKK